MFIIFSINLIKEPLLFFSGIFLCLSEISFLKYFSLFESIIWLGHILKFFGILHLAIFIYSRYLNEPLKEVRDIQKIYLPALPEEMIKLSDAFKVLKRDSEIKEEIVNINDEETFIDYLKKILSNPRETIPVLFFMKDKLIFKNDVNLPEKISEIEIEIFEKQELDDFIIFFMKRDEFSNIIYKSLFKFILINIKKIRILNELERTKKELIKLDDYRKFFLRSISHDLRTPLNIIYGYLQLLEKGYFGEFNDRIREIFSDMNKSIKKAVDMVEDILNLSKLESGEIKFKIEEINLKYLIKNILDELKIYVKEKGLSINYTYNGNETVFLDKKAIISIVSNLVLNSIKFTDKGEVKIFIELSNDILKIIVSDTGTGIPENKISDIFLPFIKVTEDERGFGLGLSIVKKYVEIMGGEILVESEVNKGTTFTIKIPLKKIEIKKEIFKEEKDILIIDQDELIRNYLKKLLPDYLIAEAIDGEEGIKKSFEYLPKVIVVHYSLPDMNGLELIRVLRERVEFKNTKFIIITSSKETTINDVEVIRKDDKPEVIKKVFDEILKK